MLKWKVLHVKYGHEIKVEQQLGRFGIVNYLPKIKIIRQWSDRKKVIITPAFPGYIFINSDNTLRNKVFYAKGVLKYVRSDNKDATLENDEIEMIRIAESSISEPQILNNHLEKGDQVEIIEGPLSGYTGELIEFMGKKRIVLFIKKIAIGFIVEIPVNHLRLI
jgi:transcription antitermination factor NusG